MSNMKQAMTACTNSPVLIYTSGACSGNNGDGAGGWGVVLNSARSGTRKICGTATGTTSNRMELVAAIEALRALKMPRSVRLHTNSEYIQKGMTEWLPNWKECDWKAPQGLRGLLAPVKNADLWRELEQVAGRHTIEWVRVNADTGGPLYATARQLARNSVVKTSTFEQHFSTPTQTSTVAPAVSSANLPWDD